MSLRYRTNYCRRIAFSQRKDSRIQVGSVRHKAQAQCSAKFWEKIIFQLSFRLGLLENSLTIIAGGFTYLALLFEEGCQQDQSRVPNHICS